MEVPKLHLIPSTDQTRPAGTFIRLTALTCGATDYFSAVILRTIEIFGNTFNELEGEIYIHPNDWKKFCAPGVVSVQFADGLFTVVHGKKPVEIFKAAKCDERFPAISTIMPEDHDYTEQASMCFDPALLLKVSEAIYPANWKGRKSVNIFSRGPGKNIIVKPNNLNNEFTIKATIMPTMSCL